MQLKVLLPHEVLLETQTEKVIAEAPNGFFCLLNRHVDLATSLVAGLLAYQEQGGRMRYLAIDEATLVKCGSEVLVSTRGAVIGGDLGQLRRIVQQQFETLDQRERTARSAAARLEAGLVRRFLELDKHVA